MSNSVAKSVPDVGVPSVDHPARTRLIDAAIEAFAAKGFHATSTRDIAAAAGLSPAAGYVFYKSKEELLYSIAKSGHELYLDLIREAVASSSDPIEQLTSAVYAFTRSHAMRHTRARVINYEWSALEPDHQHQVATVRRAINAEIAGVVANGVATGVFTTPNPAMTTVALISLGIDVARWFRDDGSWSGEAVAEHYTLLALRMLGANPSRQTTGR